MSHVQGYTSPNRPMSIRPRSQERKQEFLAIAAATGVTGTDLVNDFIDWYLGVPGAQLPQPPAIDRDPQLRTATSG